MQDYIKEARTNYKNLGKVFCPYLESEINFTSSGFKHLLWKSNQKPRTESVIRERVDSLSFVSEILAKSGILQEYEKKEDRDFYCFIAIHLNKKYKVVIAKYNNDKFKFVSVMPKWKTGKRDNRQDE